MSNYAGTMFFVLGMITFGLITVLTGLHVWDLIPPSVHPELQPVIFLMAIGLMVMGIGIKQMGDG